MRMGTGGARHGDCFLTGCRCKCAGIRDCVKRTI